MCSGYLGDNFNIIYKWTPILLIVKKINVVRGFV